MGKETTANKPVTRPGYTLEEQHKKLFQLKEPSDKKSNSDRVEKFSLYKSRPITYEINTRF